MNVAGSDDASQKGMSARMDSTHSLDRVLGSYVPAAKCRYSTFPALSPLLITLPVGKAQGDDRERPCARGGAVGSGGIWMLEALIRPPRMKHFCAHLKD
jgi:hypothetical protein